jgi:hypothetical protein
MRGRRAGLSRLRRLAAFAALVTALTGCSNGTSVAPPKPPADSTSARVAAAQRTLGDFVEALTARDPGRASALGTSDAAPVLADMARNADTLDLTDLALRFVDDRGDVVGDDRDRYGSGAWAGSVELTYRVNGWDTQPTRLETRFVFAGGSGGEKIAGIGGGDDRTPLWVTGQVSRSVAGRALVIAVGDRGSRDLALARQALLDVAKVLPGWHGRLVLEVPGSEEQLNQALAAPEGQYANIAAVTTSVDGSLVPGAPVHVFLNPAVFDGLGPRGAQVVVSHETTHVATGATFTTDVPTWLLEGFADYVALAHAGIPVATAASQILARIRKDGPPKHLPTAAELDPSATGLGATYEEAWLAARFLAQQYGEDRLVTFYRKVSAGLGVTDAFRQVLGTSETAFVTRWRADLRHLAGGVTS